MELCKPSVHITWALQYRINSNLAEMVEMVGADTHGIPAISFGLLVCGCVYAQAVEGKELGGNTGGEW